MKNNNNNAKQWQQQEIHTFEKEVKSLYFFLNINNNVKNFEK